MRTFLHLWPVCAVAFAAFSPFEDRAATDIDTPAGRHIIVVDMSFSMAKRKNAVLDAVSSIIESGLSGHIRDGELVELWTFHESVEENGFPPFLWQARGARDSARTSVDFLRKRRFANQTKMESLIPELTEAVKESRELTIVLISDGDTDIFGTPFDRSLNLTYRDYGPELRKARKPFVTILRARDGAFAAWAVIRGGDSIQVPVLPEHPRRISIASVPPPMEPTSASKEPSAVSASATSGERSQDAAAPPSTKSPDIFNPNPPNSLTTAESMAVSPPARIDSIPNSPVAEAPQEHAVEEDETIVLQTDVASPLV